MSINLHGLSPDEIRRTLGCDRSPAPLTPEEVLGLPTSERDPAVVVQAAQQRRHLIEQQADIDLQRRQQLLAVIADAEVALLHVGPSGAVAGSADNVSTADLMAPFDPSMLSTPTAEAGTASSPSKTAASPVKQDSSDAPEPTAPAATTATQHRDTEAPEVGPRQVPRVTRKARRAHTKQRRQRIAMIIGFTLGGICVAGAWSAYQAGLLPTLARTDTSHEPSSDGATRPDRQPKKKNSSPSRSGGSTNAPAKASPTDPRPARPHPTPSIPSLPVREPNAPPQPSGTTAPASSSTPTNSTTPKQPTQLSDEQLAEWNRRLELARKALTKADFATVERELAALANLPRNEMLRAKLERISLVAAYAKQFRQRLQQALAEAQGGSELRVLTQDGEKICAIVEASPEMLVIKTDGQIQRYLVDQLPPALALAVAHLALDVNDPVTKVVDAAYLATRPNLTPRDIELATRWWREARSEGVDIGELEKFFEDGPMPPP